MKAISIFGAFVTGAMLMSSIGVMISAFTGIHHAEAASAVLAVSGSGFACAIWRATNAGSVS